MARVLANYEMGQTVAIAESACVTVEAMEGTDATILRAGEIMKSLAHEPAPAGHEHEALLSRHLTVVKVAKPDQDMRFDVPVIGVKTIETMAQAGATCLAIDACECLFLDCDRAVEAAHKDDIAII